jgi:ubiquinone/menaquinone biosynthesis C-methylase UbiE
MTQRLTAVYDGVAHAWAAGPSRLYDRLAEAVLSAYPEPIAEQHVVDLGAGTGAVVRAVLRAGGRVTGVDESEDMVAHMRAQGLEAVAGDLMSLPFDDATFDGAIAAFSVSHVDDPVAALREARRVVRDGGAVVVGVFGAAPGTASRDVIDNVAERFGYVRPAWWVRFKAELEPMTNTPQRLRACALKAGLDEIVVAERTVDTGITAPAAIVATRLGTAHLAPFVESLDAAVRADLVAAAVAAVAVDAQPLRRNVVILSSRVRA